MYIIRTVEDIDVFKVKQTISESMANYLKQEVQLLRDSLEPDVPLSRFSLDIHGPIAILESGEENLSRLGLPDSIFRLMPEWVSRKAIGGIMYYVVFVLADNDFMNQIYFPANNLPKSMEKWLSEQAEVDEQTEGKFQEKPPY